MCPVLERFTSKSAQSLRSHSTSRKYYDSKIDLAALGAQMKMSSQPNLQNRLRSHLCCGFSSTTANPMSSARISSRHLIRTMQPNLWLVECGSCFCIGVANSQEPFSASSVATSNALRTRPCTSTPSDGRYVCPICGYAHVYMRACVDLRWENLAGLICIKFRRKFFVLVCYFHAILRRKQGGSQAKSDSSGTVSRCTHKTNVWITTHVWSQGKAKSVGASLRRRNQEEMEADVRA